MELKLYLENHRDFFRCLLGWEVKQEASDGVLYEGCWDVG